MNFRLPRNALGAMPNIAPERLLNEASALALDVGRFAVCFSQSTLDVAHRVLGQPTYEALEQKGNIDSLTRCSTRSKFLEDLEKLQSDGCDKLTLGFIDVVGLSEYNNSLGHIYGDNVLRVAAWALKENFEGSMVGRFGGDEFVIAIKPTGRDTTKVDSLSDKDIGKIITLEDKVYEEESDESCSKLEHRARVNLGSLLLKYGESLPSRISKAAETLISARCFEVEIRYNFADIDLDDTAILEQFDSFMLTHGVKNTRKTPRS